MTGYTVALFFASPLLELKHRLNELWWQIAIDGDSANWSIVQRLSTRLVAACERLVERCCAFWFVVLAPDIEARLLFRLKALVCLLLGLTYNSNNPRHVWWRSDTVAFWYPCDRFSTRRHQRRWSDNSWMNVDVAEGWRNWWVRVSEDSDDAGMP